MQVKCDRNLVLQNFQCILSTRDCAPAADLLAWFGRRLEKCLCNKQQLMHFQIGAKPHTLVSGCRPASWTGCTAFMYIYLFPPSYFTHLTVAMKCGVGQKETQKHSDLLERPLSLLLFSPYLYPFLSSSIQSLFFPFCLPCFFSVSHSFFHSVRLLYFDVVLAQVLSPGLLLCTATHTHMQFLSENNTSQCVRGLKHTAGSLTNRNVWESPLWLPL